MRASRQARATLTDGARSGRRPRLSRRRPLIGGSRRRRIVVARWRARSEENPDSLRSGGRQGSPLRFATLRPLGPRASRRSLRSRPGLPPSLRLERFQEARTARLPSMTLPESLSSCAPSPSFLSIPSCLKKSCFPKRELLFEEPLPFAAPVSKRQRRKEEAARAMVRRAGPWTAPATTPAAL